MATKSRVMRRAVSPEEKEQRRDDILAAAKGVFSRQGFHATTIADVARSAGLSYGSIYWYFDSKEALFHALMESEADALRVHIAAGLGQPRTSDDPLTPFKAAVRLTFEFFESDRAAVKLLFRDSLAFGDGFGRHLVDIHERFLTDIEEVIAGAQREGAVLDAPPRLLAFSVASVIGQLAQRRLVTDDGLDATAAADLAVDLVVNGLRRNS
jgi:AcrR family transcriptional regulator